MQSVYDLAGLESKVCHCTSLHCEYKFNVSGIRKKQNFLVEYEHLFLTFVM